MKRNPKVTVAIPVYNGANYIREAIESALAQTYENKEIIVVNDGSSDNGKTEAICRDFLPDITYFYQSNRGVGAALNRIIREMSGEIFTWLSHDDIHLPNKITAQVNYYNKLEVEDAIIFSDNIFINENGCKIGETKLPFEKYIESPKRILLDGAINGCTIFVPVKLLRNNKGFDERLKYVQDYDMWNKLVSEYDFFLLPESLVEYRLHKNQDTHNINATYEAEDLWIKISQSRSEVERSFISGSTQLYFQELADFLAQTPYKKAYEHVKSMLNDTYKNCRVSVIFQISQSADAQGTVRAMQSLIDQTHENIEIIVLIPDYLLSEYEIACAQIKKVDARALITKCACNENSLNWGIRSAGGDYICFIDNKSFYDAKKTEVQLKQMLAYGYLMSLTASRTISSSNIKSMAAQHSGSKYILESEEIDLSALMVHRRVASGGHFQNIVVRDGKIRFPQMTENIFEIRKMTDCLTNFVM